MENLEQVKKAVEIEVKHRYININGRTRSFSSFICSVLRKEIKENPDNPKWKVLLEYFERYPMETVPARKKSLERFVSVVKSQYIDLPKEEGFSNQKKSLSQTDVTYIKGIGPKIAYMLNKLGIYTANDLLYYFPRKHIDYSTRTRIRELEEGMNTTIFGTIRGVEAFTTKNNLGVVKNVEFLLKKVVLTIFFGVFLYCVGHGVGFTPVGTKLVHCFIGVDWAGCVKVLCYIYGCACAWCKYI